jgi:hypothetical protein
MDHPKEASHLWSETILDCPHGPDPVTNQTENRYETRDGEDVSGETVESIVLIIPKTIYFSFYSFQ